MSPSKALLSTQSSGHDVLQASQDTQDASQDIDTAAMQNLMKKRKKEVKSRRRKLQNALVNTHASRIADTRKRIEATFKAHEAASRTSRKPRLQQLAALLQQKQELEANIDARLTRIAQQFNMAAHLIKDCMGSRIGQS